MSVLIKGVEMPENGSCIQIVIDDDGKVYPSVEKCILKMGSIAKAVPVPPHGRLIDADKIPYKKIMLDDDDEFYYGVTQPYIDRMPTIILADDKDINVLDKEEGE